MESVINAQSKLCHDCGKDIEIENEELVNGVMLSYKDSNGDVIKALKCNDCYLKDKSLKNFRKCEVYSRVVGYIRPIRQWNLGKKEEFNQRKEFIVEKNSCGC